MSPAGSGGRGGHRSVRRARYDLARALLAESPPRRNEAVTQLQMATDEAGDEPPTWKLLARAAEALADTDPIEALAQFLRCFRFPTHFRTACANSAGVGKRKQRKN